MEVWLDSLKLGQYKPLFKSEGYYTAEDVENLKGLTKKELQAMGITRRGTRHVMCISFSAVNCDIATSSFC